MHREFTSHLLNADGFLKARAIGEGFDNLLTDLEASIGLDGREMAIVRTKLEEACFFAKKAMASKGENQAAPGTELPR